jgi:phosphatidylglycerol:prolipoprotein diacylglycerol transferase
MVEFPNLFTDGIYFTVDRIAFSIFGLPVYWYGIIITAAVILGIVYAMKNADKVGILPDNVFEIAFWGVLSGVIGARTYYVIFSAESMSLRDAITQIRGGGLAIYGGLIGALIGGYLAAKASKVKFAPLADLIGLGFLIGHTVGRWGNFFNQEAFGAPTAGELPWGMTGDIIRMSSEVREKQTELMNDGLALVHPCFLYESLWCLIGFVALHFYMKRFKTFDGEIFLLYVVWYGTGRSWIESLRLDSLTAGGFRVSQVLAIASAIFALGVFINLKTKLKPENGYIPHKDTDESKAAVEAHIYKVRLNKEKDRAKRIIERAHREFTDPFAMGIEDDEEEDEDDDNENEVADSNE